MKFRVSRFEFQVGGIAIEELVLMIS